MADSRQSATAPDPSARVVGDVVSPAVATITVLHPEGDSGRGVQVRDRSVVIGRDSGCDLVLTSAGVSRRHASIRARDGGLELVDLGSSNGTWLNDERLTDVASIGDGDRIRVADVELTLAVPAVPTTSGSRARPSPSDPREPAHPTDPLGHVPDSHRGGSLAREVVASEGFSAGALGLAILGSVVGMVLTTKIDLGPWGGLAGATIGPVLSATFTTRRAGERGRVRLGAMCALSALALVITISGFAVAPADLKEPLVGEDDPSAIIQSVLAEPGPSDEVSSTGGGSGSGTGGAGPSAPTGLRADPTTTAGSVTLTWEAAGTDRTITAYTVSREPANPAPATDPDPADLTYTDTVSVDDVGLVSYRVTATDEAGIVSPPSAAVCVNVPDADSGDPVTVDDDCVP